MPVRSPPASQRDTNHVEVFLIEAAEDEEDVPAQFAEKMLRTHVFGQPFNHRALGQEVPPPKQVLWGQQETTRQSLLTL